MKAINQAAKNEHEARVSGVKASLDAARDKTIEELQKHAEERINQLDKQHKEVLSHLADQAPTAVTLHKHPDGEPPKVFPQSGGDVTVVAGDYYYQVGESTIVVADADVGKGGSWQVVK